MASLLLSLHATPTFALQTFVYALIGGVFPALIWLWFWMHESHEHHEPKNTIWITFLAGMCCVFVVYPLQKLTDFLPFQSGTLGGATSGAANWNVLLIWAFFEEAVKFLAAYLIVLRSKSDTYDEPIDAFVYLMTAALGFSAMENTFFLLSPLLSGDALTGVLTGNMRFMGANLLHVASSGVLSIFLSYAYYKPKYIEKIYVIAGLITATVLHALFNLLIIMITEAEKSRLFVAFSFVWISIILLILALERVKTIKEF